MANKVDQDIMREANRKLIIQALFNAEQTSRSEIADQIELHKSTVTTIYREIEESGFIEELGEGTVSKAGGRKPKLIRFNHNLGYIVSFDLGHYHLRYMAARITGEIITQGELTITGMDIAAIQRAMLAYITQLGTLKTDRGLMGVSVAIHGVVENNRVHYAPYHLDLLSIDLAKQLESQLNVPVYLENEANLAAVYLRDYRDYDGGALLHNFITVNIHDGIGAGVILNDRLFPGVHGEAGEIGRMVMSNNHWQDEGFTGDVHLEDLFSEDALIARLARIKKIDYLTMDEFLSLWDNNDADALRLVDEWIETLAKAIFNLVQYMAPEAVFVHSRILARHPEFYTRMEARYQTIAPHTTIPLKFARRSVDRATLAGGISYTTRKLLDMIDFTLIFTDNKSKQTT
ncbi:ROK family transcriptional regulator [Weissella soli]|jgi:predicted NBD/HSP70 family sugar kinase|uniref:Putative NBD/HSP70 family sugar kinase n=1 Tax=Weissella soli TaxID=155866 RepID=A0A288QP89_9LACO|nr:ROK family transcriptional regulator [Weissella soli]AOT57066.1 Glucokinase [Weissella soli]MCT8395720.1 ROK family transcriptional regulator [Weissella soli]NKY83962.1 ROK family transcriptional regulator [Weissella soli]RDL01076.1 putative NBD/HSP70 family sugar kinase [Weissella soli]GEN93877.1 sugar kinase [Weissella soli]